MRLVCISDTHLRHPEVPEGDVLVHSGDFGMRGSLTELGAFARWVRALPHPHKVLVAGNHDWAFERNPDQARALLDGLTYLQDQAAEICGLRFWGSPWTPVFLDWAFMRTRGEDLRQVWERVPEGLDVLVTHGPPSGILDLTVHGVPAGCEELRAAVEARRPRVHVFGHIHEGYGVVERGGTVFVNASICTARYRPENAPVVIDVDEGGVRVEPVRRP